MPEWVLVIISLIGGMTLSLALSWLLKVYWRAGQRAKEAAKIKRMRREILGYLSSKGATDESVGAVWTALLEYSMQETDFEAARSLVKRVKEEGEDARISATARRAENVLKQREVVAAGGRGVQVR